MILLIEAGVGAVVTLFLISVAAGLLVAAVKSIKDISIIEVAIYAAMIYFKINPHYALLIGSIICTINLVIGRWVKALMLFMVMGLLSVFARHSMGAY